ncbi:MAG: hypothetical protein V1924_04495 [Candidatus Bathyarchaeota archaeon]
MKASKTLGVIITVVQIVSFFALVTGMYTIIGILNTTLPTGQQVIQPQMGDPVVIPFTFHPRNEGFLEATLTVSLSLVAGVDQILATDSAIVTIPAGSITPVDLELRIPLNQYQDTMTDPDLVSWKVDVKVTTLFNLISFRNTMTITGGA